MMRVYKPLYAGALICVCVAGATWGGETQPDADWPQWRGPNRDGIAVLCPKLLDAWPKEGPPLLWKSGWIPACEEGGCGSPVVADGKVFIYANAKLPLGGGNTYRLVTTEILSDAGWHPDLPEDLARKIETAWASKDRPKTTGWNWWEPERAKESDLEAFLAKKPELDKYIKDFTATLSPEEARKYGTYVRKRLCIATAGGLAWEALVKLSKLRDTGLPTLRQWQKELEKIGANNYGLVHNAWPRTFTWSDTVICLDAATGKEVWRKVFPVDKTNIKDPSVQWWSFDTGGISIGVCATPAVWGGKCFAAGSMGLYCFSAKDGTLLWQIKGPPEHASPLVAGGIVYHVGRAYNAETGAVLWQHPLWDGKHKRYESESRYSSPLLLASGGKHYVITSDFGALGHASYCCLDMETGKVLWSEKGDINPILTMRGDILMMAAAYGGSGARAYRVTPAGAELLWKRPFSDGHGDILWQDHLYVAGHVYKCVDLKTGEFNWKKSMPTGVGQFSSTVFADGEIIAPVGECHQLTKNFGDLTYSLTMIKATPEKYTELATFNPKMCMMTSPAIAGGKLYLRALDGVACYDLREHGAYLDGVAAAPDTLTFRFRQTGGGLALKDAANGIQIADASGTRPAKAQFNGDEIVVDIKDAAVPFGVSCAAGALATKDGRTVPAFVWNEARLLKFRKCFDKTIMLLSDLPLQQDGRWNKPETYEIAGAKVTRIDLDPQGKGVNLITDKSWKVGETLALSHPAYPVGRGDPRCEKLTATVAEPQRAAVRFVKVDETTSGNWKGIYGSEGALICADKASTAPKCALVTIMNKEDKIPWAPNASEARFLLKSGDAKERTVSSWHAPEQFDVSVEITDGKPHQVALYCMAWGKHGTMTVEVLDSDTRAVLDTQPVKEFVNGKYLIWDVKGHVILRVSTLVREEGHEALASGIFVDPSGKAGQ